MKKLQIILNIYLLLLVTNGFAQKTYPTDRNFTRIYKTGPCSVRIYKTPVNYIAFFYDEQKTLVKRAIYLRDFKIKSMPFNNDWLTDTMIEYYRNGVIKSRIPYNNGLRHGEATYYYETGIKQTVKHFINNNIEGIEISFDQTGDTSSVGKTIRGNKNGKFLESSVNNYYRYGLYVANHLKRATIYRSDKTISSDYLFKDSLDVQILDSVIIYDTLNTSINKVISRVRFYPGYRNFVPGQSEYLKQESTLNDTTNCIYYKKTIMNYHAFLEKNLIYPQLCQENSQSGKVYVLFIVSKEGHFIDVFAANNATHKDLKEEATRVVKLLEGEFIQTKIHPSIGIIPITFELSE